FGSRGYFGRPHMPGVLPLHPARLLPAWPLRSSDRPRPTQPKGSTIRPEQKEFASSDHLVLRATRCSFDDAKSVRNALIPISRPGAVGFGHALPRPFRHPEKPPSTDHTQDVHAHHKKWHRYIPVPRPGIHPRDARVLVSQKTNNRNQRDEEQTAEESH